MRPDVVIACGALVYAGLLSTARNLYGQGFVDAWSLTILVGLTVPFLVWAERRRRA